MSTQTIRDRSGWIIGTIETDSSGIQTGKDRAGWIVGTYDPKEDKTRDRANWIVSESGNILASLIMTATAETDASRRR